MVVPRVARMFCRVRIWGLRDGKRSQSADVLALLDDDAAVSVIGSKLAAELGGDLLVNAERIDGHDLDLMSAEIKACAADCTVRRKPVVVSDVLMGRTSSKERMIVGRDYMQRTVMMRLAESARDEWSGLPGPEELEGFCAGLDEELRPTRSAR